MADMMNREPCFWTSTTPGYNTSDRERWITVDGKRVKEKFPQRGHQGDYDDRRVARGERWMLVVKGNGNTYRVPVTNAAGIMDSANGYGAYMRGKARHFGWFHPGNCVCALVGSGGMFAENIVEKSVLKQQPCAPGTYSVKDPCPHTKAEISARQAAHTKIQDEREAAFKSKEDKTIDALREQTQALVGAATSQRDQTQTIIESIAKQFEPAARRKKDE